MRKLYRFFLPTLKYANCLVTNVFLMPKKISVSFKAWSKLADKQKILRIHYVLYSLNCISIYYPSYLQIFSHENDTSQTFFWIFYIYSIIFWINKQSMKQSNRLNKGTFHFSNFFWLNFVKNGCPTVHLTMDRFLLCIPQQSVCENWVLAAALYVWGTVLQTDKSGHFQGYFIQQLNPLSDNSDLRSNQWFAVTPLVWGHHTTTGIR